MLTIRFSRVGRKNKAQFRIVLQQHTMTPTGKHIAVLGSYDPHQKKAIIKADEVKQWIAKGAQVSDSVYNLCIREGVIVGKKRAVKMERPKLPVKTEAEIVVEKAPVASVETESKPAIEVPEVAVKVEAPVAAASEKVAPVEAKPEVAEKVETPVAA
ncbi:MAG: 30S ribosomal protein S16 [Candidatus Moraniibacteriota bacterium]